MEVYRVRYTISGEIEVSAKSADDAYRQVHEMTTQTMCDLGDPWVRIDHPVSETMSRVNELADRLQREVGELKAYFSAVTRTDAGHE